jgi:hypothetical protein
MMHLCAWCQAPVSHGFAGDSEAAVLSGLCPTCFQAFERQRGTEVLAWVEEVAHPTVVVDQEVRIRAANQPACDLLQADWVALLGRPLCEVLGCGASHPARGEEPETVHPRCAVHSLVDRTFLLGSSGATALAGSRDGGDPTAPYAGHLITSLRVGEAVALRLDPLMQSA